VTNPTPIAKLFRVPDLDPEHQAQLEAERDREREREAQLERDIAAANARKRLDGFKLPLTAADEAMLLEETLDLAFGKSIAGIVAWEAESYTQHPWQLLIGSTGRGKTLAAAWMLNRVGGRYLKARDLERLYAAQFGKESDAFREWKANKELLVLDELGTEHDSAVLTAALLDLVDCRRGLGHRTIAIANMSEAALRARYPDLRLWSRLGECARWVADAGADRRVKR
jgi:DNA replication protein DnaC